MKILKVTILPLLVILFFSNNVLAQDKIRVMSYNVLCGMETDTTKTKKSFSEWINKHQPDIIAYEEMNEFTQKGLEEFARSIGHPYATILQEKGYPPALSSKYPIINIRKVTDNMHHGFIQAKIKDINFIILHLSPFMYEKRNEEIDVILATIASYPKDEKWMLIGDFNSVSPLDSEYYEDGKFAKSQEGGDKAYSYIQNLKNGKVDFEVQQKILDAGFIDVLKKYHSGFTNTCETKIFNKKHIAPDSRIDFIYVSKNMDNETLDSKVLVDDFTDFASDHYPILLDITNR